MDMSTSITDGAGDPQAYQVRELQGYCARAYKDAFTACLGQPVGLRVQALPYGAECSGTSQNHLLEEHFDA